MWNCLVHRPGTESALCQTCFVGRMMHHLLPAAEGVVANGFAARTGGIVQVIVLKGDGGLLWEPGDNRSVTVPEVVPTGRVVSLECAYGYTDNTAPAVATMDEETAAELEVKEEQDTPQNTAAAAVAKAMMTMGELGDSCRAFEEV